MLQGEREITLRFLAEPPDINFEGKVRGGAVMKWIDQAGYACAVGWSGQFGVTVYVGAIRFYKLVLIDDVVEVSAKLIYTGRTSMHITVEVSAGDPKEARLTNTRRCVIVFVALNDQGAPAEIERWRPETEEDAALEQYAKRLMELRKGIEEGARIHAGLRDTRDRGVPVMDVKAVEGRSVGECP
jgi:acyl-CoA hydrolase